MRPWRNAAACSGPPRPASPWAVCRPRRAPRARPHAAACTGDDVERNAGAALARARGCGASGRDTGAALVIRLFFLPACGLLRAAAFARRNGRCERRAQPAVTVYGDLRRDAGRSACVRRGGRALAAPALHSAGLPFFCRQHRDLLAAADFRRRQDSCRARVLRLDQRVQPVCGVGVLVVYGRPVHERAGQAVSLPPADPPARCSARR